MNLLNRRFLYYETGFAILAFILGTLSHFAYEFSGNSSFVGLFTPVSESTWEHLKLLFFPVLLFSLLEYVLIGAEFPFYIPAKAIGLTAGMSFIIVFFYTYTGIIGKNFLWVDILTFFVGVVLTYWISCRLSTRKKAGNLIDIALSLSFLLILTFLFFLFTAYQPDINLFQSLPSDVLKN